MIFRYIALFSWLVADLAILNICPSSAQFHSHLKLSRELWSRYPGRLQLALHLLQLIRYSNLAHYPTPYSNSTYCTLSSFCPLDSRLTWSIFHPVRTGRSESEVW
ncbi:hypothetical protein B0H14DRAFT_3029187 [Mycena olivaceomarginata]|nr:hypothetical protein B0H14DRAFT_3029187 [Mycena olivaceomarginata]